MNNKKLAIYIKKNNVFYLVIDRFTFTKKRCIIRKYLIDKG